MATLEVHDGRGRVEIVTISRDHTALFGSDPKCDVVMDDPQVLPFHGRLRYKGGKYRAEAFPEAQALAINGKKVVAASLAQGDEIKVGAYKIFLVNPEDGPADTDKTREQAPPKSKKMVKGGRRRRHARASTAAKAAIGRRGGQARRMPPKPPEPIKKFMNVLLAKDQRPGEEKIVSSPLVLALVVAFALLVAAGIGLYSVISRTTADRQFNTAMDDYRESSYLAALKGFDQFLGSNPHEARAGTARVKRAMASVHQYTSMGAPNWTAALEAARDAYKKVGNEKGFEDDRLNLAALVLKTAEGLADRAKQAADRSACSPTSTSRRDPPRQGGGRRRAGPAGKSRFPSKLAEANAAVLKAQTRTKFLADMDAALKAGSSTEVYNLRDGLVARYPDFNVDKDVVAKLTAANDLVKKAVAFDPAGRSRPRPSRTPSRSARRSRSWSAPTRTRSRARPGRSSTPSAQGHVYALDGANGAPIWHVPIGLTTPVRPGCRSAANSRRA